MRDLTGNMPTLPRDFPDYFPLIVRTASDGLRELAMASVRNVKEARRRTSYSRS